MSGRRTVWTLLALAAGALSFGILAGPAAAEVKPSFEPTSCEDLPDIGDVLPRLRCGVVRVPRDHAHPDGPTLALAVVVVGSGLQPALPDPIVYISGGPGCEPARPRAVAARCLPRVVGARTRAGGAT